MAEELEEEEELSPEPRPPSPDTERRIIARFLDLIAAGFVALAVALGFEGDYARAAIALVSGFAVFLCGIYWANIRSLIGPTLSASMLRVASDARSWLMVVLLIFLYIAWPQLDRVFTNPPATSITNETHQPATPITNDAHRSRGKIYQPGFI